MGAFLSRRSRRVPAYRQHLAARSVESWAMRAAKGFLLFLAISPACFVIDWLFHVFPDAYPVIHRMHGLGAAPKILWVASAPLAVASAWMLTRRPVLGALTGVLFVVTYTCAAVVLWGQFTPGCWLAVGASLLSWYGLLQRVRANRGDAA
jgi:hypothetical protein